MRNKIVSIASASTLVVFGWAASAHADDVVCNGETIAGVTIDGNVIVTGPCALTDVTVKGNVLVEGGGALEVFAPTEVNGSIQSSGGDFVRIFGNGVNINGDLQLDNTGPASSGYQAGTVIGGSVQYVANTATPLSAIGGVVNGDVQLFDNTGGALIGTNTIGGNLQCKENSPAPSPFGANTVGGNKEDQCAEDLGF